MSDDGILERLSELSGLPGDSKLFVQALTHPSRANEQPGTPDNQRLEFLGDSVLGLCASEVLFGEFPGADEGTLTRLRAQLVNAEALADWGRSVGLSGAVRLGRGAYAAQLGDSTNVLADAVEALIAASYLEHGLEGARRLCRVVVRHGLDKVPAPEERDPKSTLQERLQGLGRPAPSYALLEASGPSHERWFKVEVRGEGVVAEGEGRSKRAAEQAAALVALRALDEGERAEEPPQRRSEGPA